MKKPENFENSFILDTFKIRDSYYMARSWKEVNTWNFPSIVFNDINSTDLGCLAAEYDPDSDKLVVVPVDCQEQRGIVCKTLNYKSVKTCDREIMNYYRLEALLNPLFQDFRNYESNKSKSVIQDMFKRLNQTEAFQALFSTLWYASLPCYDIKNVTAQKNGERAVIKYCEWKGVPISCAAIFSSYPTDQGMCCSFNMKAANEIYQSGSYSDIITKMQNGDDSISFENSTKPSWYLKTSEPIILPGRNKGLFLILDAHMDQFSSTSQPNDFNGFYGLVHPSGSFPIMSLEGFEIKPGHRNAVSISGTRIYADENLKDLDIKDRKCMFKNDNTDLIIHQEYTYSNCMLECSLLYARDMVKHFEDMVNFSSQNLHNFYPVSPTAYI